MLFCKCCGDECEVIEFDAGIGSYEFWGSVGNDVQMCLGSSCCEAEVVDENGDEVEMSEYIETCEEGDY